MRRLWFSFFLLVSANELAESQQLSVADLDRRRAAALEALKSQDPAVVLGTAHDLLVPICEHADGWACYNLGVIEFRRGQLARSRSDKDICFAKAYMFYTVAEQLGFGAAKGEAESAVGLVSDPSAKARADELIKELQRKQSAIRTNHQRQVPGVSTEGNDLIHEGIAQGTSVNRTKKSTSDWMKFDARAVMWKMDGDGACFYMVTDYIGDATCVLSGYQIEDTSSMFGGNHSFKSVKFFGAAKKVEFFSGKDLEGESVALENDLKSSLQGRLRFQRSSETVSSSRSLRVR